MRGISLLFLFMFDSMWSGAAHAIPAFAIREKVSCTVCHTNGSAPHLTQTGYVYRRAGFRFPQNIGNKAIDDQNMEALKHIAVGLNVDYDLITNKPQAGAETLTANHFDMREAEVWGAGAFLGNYGTWVELDMTPNSVPANMGPPSVTGGSGGSVAGVELTQADLRFVDGNKDFYYGLRAGKMAPEGFGASDQWFDDGAIPIMDALSARHWATGLDTLAQPVGAMNQPQFGVEFEANWPTTFVTLGIYNGFDGTSGFDPTNPGGLQDPATGVFHGSMNPAQMNSQGKGSKDVKLQVDQIWERFALTGIYYNGRIPLVEPQMGTTVFNDNYQLGRVYGTFLLDPNVIDLMAGGGAGQYQFASAGGSTPAGNFDNLGAFVGANWYVKAHLSVSARFDYYQYDTSATPRPHAQSGTLLASLPYENNIWVFHLIRTEDSYAGLTNDFRAEWRFLF